MLWTAPTFSTGMSRVAQGAETLPDAYGQAIKAARVGRQLHGAGAVAHFDQLGVYRLLSLVNDTAELHAFVKETLGPLAGDDDAENADLRLVNDRRSEQAAADAVIGDGERAALYLVWP